MVTLLHLACHAACYMSSTRVAVDTARYLHYACSITVQGKQRQGAILMPNCFLTETDSTCRSCPHGISAPNVTERQFVPYDLCISQCWEPMLSSLQLTVAAQLTMAVPVFNHITMLTVLTVTVKLSAYSAGKLQLHSYPKASM